MKMTYGALHSAKVATFDTIVQIRYECILMLLLRLQKERTPNLE